MTTYLRVKNLDKHQHYKDRRPPWIKLHAEVLDDYEFACLQDASKVHLMLIWVLASRMDNRIPNDATWIGRKVNATDPVDIAALVSAGFLEVCDGDGKPVQHASVPLATCKQTAMPETERETEEKRETDKAPNGARRGAQTDRAGRKAKGEPAPWMGKMAKVWRDAYGGPPPAQMVKALRPAVRELGEDVVAERLAIYCGQTAATFTNLHKFAATIGMWTPEQRGGAEEREHPEDARLRAFAEEHRRQAAENDAWMMERLREKGYLPKVAA